jgi:hypothetical protein
MTIGFCVIGAVLFFGFPEVRDATLHFDWSKVAAAIVRQFGFQ